MMTGWRRSFLGGEEEEEEGEGEGVESRGGTDGSSGRAIGSRRAGRGISRGWRGSEGNVNSA